MKRLLWLALGVVLSGCVPDERTLPFRDDFSGPPAQWDVVSGEWLMRHGKYSMTTKKWGRQITLATRGLKNGSVSGIARPVEASTLGWGSFGVMVKYLDSANWIAVRYGAYDGISVLKNVAGTLDVLSIAKLKAEIGREYRFRVQISGSKLTVYLDGKATGEARVPFANEEGRPGLYTEGPTEFDDIAILGAVPLAKPKPDLPGTPKLALEFASWRPDFPMKEEAVSLHGTMFIYVRNRGSGPARLYRLSMDGKDADGLVRSGDIGWYRQQPDLVAPGGVAEIEIRLPVLPEEAGLAMFRDETARPRVSFEIESVGGKPLGVEAEFTTQSEPLQINIIAFAPGLKKVYVYVQNNRVIFGGNKTPFHLKSISVDGRDVTHLARFGSREVASDVVPIEIDLQEPIPEGKPTVVCIHTAEGTSAGHCLRAFAFDFPIQVTLLGKQARKDAVEDIFNHCANCIGVCGASADWLVKAKRLGMRGFHYGGSLSKMLQWDKPEYAPLCAFWLDEMDDLPLRQVVENVAEARNYYLKMGRFAPAQMLNLCRPRSIRGCDYIVLGDACSGAYGWDGGALGEGFADLAYLPFREYRRSRRAFFPYFRNAELPLIYNPETKKITGREAERGRRTIEPREERWMTYGCLIQGAKGICHWNYGTGIRKPPNWFSKEHWILRAAMGGALLGGPDGVDIPKDARDELTAIWREIAEINVELRTIGTLVAISDVSYLARVESSAQGGVPASAAALVCGLDTVIVIVLNQNIKTNRSLAQPKGIEAYDPVDVDVTLRVPKWLEPRASFVVRHTGIAPIAPVTESGRMKFHLEKLAVNEIIVVTKDESLRGAMETVRQEMKARVGRIRP